MNARNANTSAKWRNGTAQQKTKGLVWSQAETNYLIENCGELTVLELKKVLNRSQNAIESKIRKLRKSGRVTVPRVAARADRWTDDDIKYLLNNRGKITDEEISNHLGRTIRAIREQASKLKLRGYNVPDELNTGRRMNKCSICVDCQRAAGPQMCTWARFGVLVQGCKGEKTMLNGEIPSFRVDWCPLFKRDEKTKGIKLCWN